MNIRDNLKKNPAEIRPVQAQVTDENYYIHPKLKRDLDGIISTLENIEDFGNEMGNRNYIFAGPAGTGKSLGVQYIATRLGFPVYDGKMIMNAQNVSAAFNHLRQQTQSGPLIFLINELDKLSSRSEVIDPAQQQTLHQLLDEMDGVESNNGIFMFGTTNRPNKIDNALRRTKRFSKEISFMPPDRQGRLAILKMHAHGKGGHKFRVDHDDMEHAADVTYGYTGADLVGLLNEAFTNARLDGRTEVKQEDLEYALTKTGPSALRDMPFIEAKLRFIDMGGYNGHKDLLHRIVANSTGSTLLFYGQKGNGKTRFAEALAGEYGFNCISISGSEPEDKYVGETGSTIDTYIDRAKQSAPCVLFFDEIDALVEKQGITSHKSSWTGLLQSRLSKPIEGVYFIATVNNALGLTSTFRDRFVHKLYFGMPTTDEQEAVWNLYLPEGMGAKEIVQANPGLSCRDIARTCQLASDYGIEPDIEVYKRLIKDIKNETEADYDKMRRIIGDSVQDFQRVQECIKK